MPPDRVSCRPFGTRHTIAFTQPWAFAHRRNQSCANGNRHNPEFSSVQAKPVSKHGKTGGRQRDRGNAVAGSATGKQNRQASGRQAGGDRSWGAGMSELDYAKLWFKQFARFHGVAQFAEWRFTQEQVIAFLRHEKGGGSPTWKRPKMAESIDLFQRTFFSQAVGDLTTICGTLRDHAEKERVMQRHAEQDRWDGSAIDEAVGLIDPREPELIRGFRRALRLQKRELETERAYVKHAQAFMRERSLDTVASCACVGPKDVETFLSDKALRGNVSESTQE